MKKLVLIILYFVCLGNVNCQQKQITPQEFKAKVKSLAAEEGVKHGKIALSVVNANSGKSVFDYNGEKMMNPASILKLLTATAALNTFDKDYTIKTNFGYSGTVEEGVLTGSLVIRGNGDPTLGSNKFEETNIYSIFENVYIALFESGISQINGSVIADAFNFGSDITPSKWLFEDIGNYYGTGCAAINIFENQFKITFKSGKTGDGTEIINVDPEIPNFDLVNEVIAGTKYSGDNAYVYSVPFANQAIIRGTIPSYKNEFSIKAAINDPAKLMAKLLYEYLMDRGIEIDGTYESNYDKYTDIGFTKSLYIHESPPISKIIYWMNMRSINLYAESLAKNLNNSCTTINNTEYAMKDMYKFLTENDLYDETIIVYDASGLSPMNRISTNAMCSILSFAHKQSFSNVLKQTISTAGSANDGNMAYVLRKTAAANNLKAKSGYMSNCRSYAGFFQNEAGEDFTFTFIINDFTCTAKEVKKFMLSVMEDLPVAF